MHELPAYLYRVESHLHWLLASRIIPLWGQASQLSASGPGYKFLLAQTMHYFVSKYSPA